MSALLPLGWLLAVALALALLHRRRGRRALADAAHELRGSATTLALAAAAMRHEPGGLHRARALESEMSRMHAALADLDAARMGRRAAPNPAAVPLERALRLAAAAWRPAAMREGRRVSLRWEAGPVSVRADRGRLAQLLGNLMSNAIEHGSGPIRLSGRRRGRSVVLEVVDGGPAGPPPSEPTGARSERGRGLGIAARAAEEAGGRLVVSSTSAGTTAAVELPVADP